MGKMTSKPKRLTEYDKVLIQHLEHKYQRPEFQPGQIWLTHMKKDLVVGNRTVKLNLPWKLVVVVIGIAGRRIAGEDDLLVVPEHDKALYPHIGTLDVKVDVGGMDQ